MRDKAYKIGQIAIKTADKAVDIIVLVPLILMLMFGIYCLWDSEMVYAEADSSTYTAYRPTSTDSVSFEELQIINPEIFAWITVNDTGIDYPVAQTDDNSKYVTTNYKGTYSMIGTIFLDYRNSSDFSDFNSIIYGHHMEKKKMFGPLSDFADKEYFDTHLYGNLYYNGENHGIEFFAVILTDAYDTKIYKPGITKEDKKQSYLDNIKEKAVNYRDIGVTTEDHLVLLSTCTEDITSGRYLLVGRLTDEYYPQEEVEEEDLSPSGQGTGIDSAKTLVESIPTWAIAPALILIVLIITAVVILSTRKKKKREKEINDKSED